MTESELPINDEDNANEECDYRGIKELEKAFLAHVVKPLKDERKEELFDNILYHRHRVATILRYCHLTDDEENQFLEELSNEELERYIMYLRYTKYLENLKHSQASIFEEFEFTEEQRDIIKEGKIKGHLKELALTKEEIALLEKGKIKDHLLVAAIKELLSKETDKNSELDA